MKVFRKSFSAAMLAAAALTALAAGVIAADHTGYWRRADDETLSKRPLQRTVVPSSYDVFSLDRERLRSILSRAPQEFSSMNEPMVIELPMPDGTLAKFRVEHSLVVEQGLADKYPELGETYIGQGVDDPTATVRFDTLRGGFHAMVLSPKGTVMIDPYAEGDNENYITYYKKDAPRTSGFHCLVGESDYDSLARPNGFRSEDVIPDFSNEVISGTQLRTYRLALAANWEYCNAVGSNTVAGCLAAQVLIMNRVNGVYERDLSMRMVMVANNNLIVYAGDNTTCPVGTGGTPCTSANDPYSNGTGALNQNTANLNAVIGSANYDIGHVFTTGSGGVASLNVPCGASKGAGTTGLPNPVGDPFAIDYVAHEMGHQWGSNHTFNSTISNCGGGNRSAANAYEPGSGITVMAYAGICGNNDLASNSIDTFHVRSLEVIVAFSQTGNGNTCATTTATGNTPPSVSVVGANNWNIPKQTPFSLTASASDVNGDTITYDWQEYDLGSAATTVPNTDADGIKPIFRAYPPVASPTRFFPSLQYILNNANVPPSTQGSCPAGSCMTGELLPTVTRTMNFQVIARDNRAGGGGINTATATVNVDGNSGPFVVTAPNTGVTYNGGSSQTVTWNVANTTAAPVNAATVNILFSSDGGQTFPTVIASGTANDGTETVTIPNVQTAQARIKVEGSNNIFFDISDTNFTVNATVAQNRTISDFDGDGKSDVAVWRESNGVWYWLNSSNNTFNAVQFGTVGDKITPGDYDGDGKTDQAVYRPSLGVWYILRSTQGFTAVGFGLPTDLPAQGDFDGDGKTDVSVWRPDSGTWFRLNSSNGAFSATQFGTTGDKPVAADFDGDGKTDQAVYRPSNGVWYWLRSTNGQLGFQQFGITTDKVAPGDFDGDGKADQAVFRDGTWFVQRSTAGFMAVNFGSTGDIAAPADFDGDGKADIDVYRPSNGVWYRLNSSNGAFNATQFGTTGDVPVPAGYVPVQ